MDESKRPFGYVPEPDLRGIQPLVYEVDKEKKSSGPRPNRHMNRNRDRRGGRINAMGSATRSDRFLDREFTQSSQRPANRWSRRPGSWLIKDPRFLSWFTLILLTPQCWLCSCNSSIHINRFVMEISSIWFLRKLYTAAISWYPCMLKLVIWLLLCYFYFLGHRCQCIFEWFWEVNKGCNLWQIRLYFSTS